MFTDESGARAVVVQWFSRALCLGVVLVAGAIVFTLLTYVPLPGLGGILGPQKTPGPPARTEVAVDTDRKENPVTSLSAPEAFAARPQQPAATSAVKPRYTAASKRDAPAQPGTAGAAPVAPAITPSATPPKRPDAQPTTKAANPQSTSATPNARSADGTPTARSTAGRDNGKPVGPPTTATPGTTE